MLNMSTTQERITLAYKKENERRLKAGERRLTKTALWKAAVFGIVANYFLRELKID